MESLKWKIVNPESRRDKLVWIIAKVHINPKSETGLLEIRDKIRELTKEEPIPNKLHDSSDYVGRDLELSLCRPNK